jgi:6-phosphogluconolactonase
MDLHVLNTADDVLRSLADYFVTIANEAIAARGRFAVALSGGSSPKKLYELLASSTYRAEVNWTSATYPKIRPIATT